MAKVRDSHDHQSDGIKVIFDQSSPSNSPTRSRSRGSEGSSHSSVSSLRRGRTSYRKRYRSSSSTSSRSRSQSRSRSHPRCRRHSRCRCNSRHRYGHVRNHQSQSNHYRSRSRSSSRQSRHRRSRNKSSQSSSINHKSCSNSRSSAHHDSLRLDDKRELLKASKDNAMLIPETEQLELSRSVEPILLDQPESKWESQKSGRWVRHDPEKTLSQSDDSESEDMPAPKIAPKRNIISFSLNNSVAKPVVAAQSFAKVTARVDIYEGRKPYGHWVPVKSGRRRKRTLATVR